MPIHEKTSVNFLTQRIIWQGCIVFFLALLVRFLGNSTLPLHTDELLHVLAGQSWASEGSFRILDGEYLRARGYTILTGTTFELFGRNDLFIARLPSVLAGSLLAAAIFIWLSRVAGTIPAWIGAVMFCFTSYAIVISQFARFYALHALLIWFGSAAVYALMSSSQMSRALKLIVAALLAFSIAMHLQVTTVIALLALLSWVLVDLSSQPFIRSALKDKRLRAWLALACILLLLILIAGGWIFGGEFRYTPSWNLADQNNVLYYVKEFGRSMPLILLLLPLALVLAASQWPRPALFCFIMAVVPVIFHSFGGMKSARYVFYSMPYLFSLWGMALYVLGHALYATIEGGVQALQKNIPVNFSYLGKRCLILFVIVISLLGGLMANPIYRDTLKSLKYSLALCVRDPAALIAPPPDAPWSTHQYELRAAVGSPSVLIVGHDFRAVAYLASFDLLLNTTRVLDAGAEFALDPRTGRRAIMSGKAVTQVVECYPDGVIVIPNDRWRTYLGISDDAADAIEQLTHSITPAIDGFHIFKWQGRRVPAACESIRKVVVGVRHS